MVVGTGRLEERVIAAELDPAHEPCLGQLAESPVYRRKVHRNARALPDILRRVRDARGVQRLQERYPLTRRRKACVAQLHLFGLFHPPTLPRRYQHAKDLHLLPASDTLPFMEAFLLSASAVGLVSLVSLVGITTLSLNIAFLKRAVFLLIALAAGALLGDAFIHIIPEALGETDPLMVSLAILAGILSFFILEKFLHWHHSHGEEEYSPEHGRIHPVGQLVLVSDGIHNLIDGLAIGASFMVSPAVGVATTLAIVLHEIPQEIGDFGLLLHAGFSRARALLLNFISALAAFAGLFLAFFIAESDGNLIPLITAFAAGNFVYIALADIVPELQKTRGAARTVLQFAFLAAGIGLMLLLGLAE
jgi:zinc and cadmium transporter